MSGKKKQKLLEKYLEKKQRQKERDSLVEQLKVLQSKSQEIKSCTLTSSSLLVRRKKTVAKTDKKTAAEKAEEPSTKDQAVSTAEPVTPESEDTKMSISDLLKTVSSEQLCDGVIWKKAEKRKLLSDSENDEISHTVKQSKPDVAAKLIKTNKVHSKNREIASTLPITHMEDEIVSSVKNNHITIITGGTGTGKSTQVPQFLYENGLAEHKKICITQPRRVSAYAVANRISQEQNQGIGGVCGYRMRYDTKACDSTKILVLTEGVLLQELSDDPFLSEYSVIVLDEVHERSLHQDTILLVLSKLVAKTNIRLVLMSASITDEYVAAVASISGAKINKVQIETQMHSVEIHHLPLRAYNYLDELKRRVESLDEEDGSILAFVSTKEETERVREELQMNNKEVYSLHSDTTEEAQKLILGSSNVVIVATNVAETSLTLPDVKYVIDGGREVQKKYNYSTNTYTYSTVLISKESANQRRGRTGRVGNGVCYRVYTTVEYEKMGSNREPEIERERVLPMVSALLKAGMRPSRIARVQCITAPPLTAIDTELETLKRLSIVTEEELTSFGKKCLSLPISPMLGAALLQAYSKSHSNLDCMLNIIVSIETYNAKKVHYIPNYIPNTKTYIETLSRPATHTQNRTKLARHILKAFNKLLECGENSSSNTSAIDVDATVKKALSQSINTIDADIGIACGKILAWCFASNIITAYKGKYYYMEKEVRVRSPLPEILSDTPVPIVCHSVVHPDLEDAQKIAMVCSVISEY
ncbi:uncharacterized protein NESG_01166 [Nematocida ausubeli]|uniref:Uncharacterized protein n=1 Tax=Nematocida ausubeli (strain ATCC PRA-371 / ERTm2) TaxID=1913371 RepID=A0A086J1N6_NEMA1|nr:uncharacterized protein NESG_01166 [Nematocida ausubeli]KFG26054.1 hypothetical protein NESG_01166 [Nematocida ausubeli]